VRRELLGEAGIVTKPLSNIDVVDAALCALAAQALLAGRFQTYGDAEEGFIVVPAWVTTPTAGADPVEATAAGSVAR
jgi:predicted RNase H-like nuclease